MKVLVIGGTSFIGRYLVEGLAARAIDFEVTTHRGAEGLRRCDLTDPQAVREAVASGVFDAVVNCAGATATDDPATLFRVHVLGAINLIQAMAELAPEAHLVLLGSAAEYGRVPVAALPVDEDRPPEPLTYFAASKLGQTELARVAARVTPLRITVLRPFNILGPGLPATYFAGAFAQTLQTAAARGESGEVAVRNAAATRDFVDVRDVAEAVMRTIVTTASPDEDSFTLWNIATGTETRILDVAARLCRLAGPFRAVAGVREESRSGIDRSRGDATRLTARTGWHPTITWEESVDALWDEISARS